MLESLNNILGRKETVKINLYSVVVYSWHMWKNKTIIPT